MQVEKYSVNHHPIQTLLTWIESGEIAIPEIQRPFVWDASKVRDLIDSLYEGFPIGYLIAWRNPNVKLKDGSSSKGKRVLIDGQQRITALMAAILEKQIINKDYKRIKIIIAFHPKDKKFEVFNPAIEKDKNWISNIATVLSPKCKPHKFVSDYCKENQITEEDEIDEIADSIEILRGIINNHIGLIELNSDLGIEIVTEIFIRINSQGAVLSQADFAMSKIAANENYEGVKLRKCIDYFCHLAVEPDFFGKLTDFDKKFTLTEYFQKMSWLKNENDDLYNPSYTDMLRVAFTSEFERGRLQDLVALLSGRNFETRDYEEEIAKESFTKLKKGLLTFMNESHFKRFLMILQSAGFIESSMISSQNAINFAYIAYLIMKREQYEPSIIEHNVRRWFVMSLLTGRYSASPESAFDFDIKRISAIGFSKYLQEVEESDLSESFWLVGLPQQMITSVASSPYFKVFLASQVHSLDKGFLSKDITITDLIKYRGDIHHIFPKNYLKEQGLNRGQYNQISNYVMMQSEINIAIGYSSPTVYFTKLINEPGSFGAITDMDEIQDNFRMHCLPPEMESKTVIDFDEFLSERRKLMSEKIKNYYGKL